MKKHWKIFFALTLCIACSDILFIWINYRAAHNELSYNFDQTDDKVHSSFELTLANTKIRMLQIATFAAEDERIQQLFLAGKKAVEAEGGYGGGPKAAAIRNKLHSLVEKPRKKLEELYDFRQLHFQFGPGSLSFLRVHRPTKFGDRMDDIRHTIVAVNKDHQPVAGFETGRVYSGIRGVVPVYAEDKSLAKRVYVGALEAGTAFQTTLDVVAKSQKANLAVVLGLEHLRGRVWPEFLKKILQTHPPIHGYVVESTTSSQITEILNLFDEKQQQSRKHHLICTLDDQLTYDISFFPLRDFQGTQAPQVPDAGHVVLWRNIDQELASFYRTLKINICYGIGGFFLVELLLFFGMRTSTRRLEAVIDEGQEQLRQSLQEVRKSRERFRTVADYAYDWEIWILPDGSTEYISPSCERITGYSAQEFQADPELRMRIIHPDDLPRIHDHQKLHLQRESGIAFVEFRIFHKNGGIVWIWHECQPVCNEEGKWLGRRISNRDITDKKQIELKLKEDRDLFMSGPVITFTWKNESDWPVEQVSSNVIDILGYSDREFLNGSVHYGSLIHPDDRKRVQQEIRTAGQSDKNHLSHPPYRLLSRDDKVIWVLDHTSLIRNEEGKISRFRGYLIDISKTMEAEEALRENKERLELIIDGADLGTWEWNIKTGEIILNDQWSRMLGYEPDEIPPDVSSWEDLIHPEDHAMTEKALTDHLAGRTPLYLAEHRLLHKTGGWVWVLDVGKVFSRAADGTPLRAAGIHMDISARKELEQTLLTAKEVAEKANKAKSIFFTNTSHELRTPLNAILGYTQLFLQDRSLSPQQQDGIRTIHQSAEHLLLMINDILDLSRMEANRMELVLSSFPLHEFLESVTNIIRVQAREKNIAFHYLPAPDLPFAVETDGQRLRQVLLNLLANAVKFTEQGWVRFLVTTKAVPESSDRVGLTFVVDDTGPGIPREQQETIFHPFRQLGERLHSTEGSGLGLTISRGLVQMMGGELELESPLEEKDRPMEGGPGSRFSFTIEVTASQPEDETGTKETEDHTLPPEADTRFLGKKILLVDDEASNRIMMHHSLAPYGFLLEEAASGKEALERYKAFQPDLILMDLVMPDGNGYEATRKIREEEGDLAIPIIAVSADVDGEGTIEQRCHQAGCNGYLAKPLDLKTVHTLLEHYLLPSIDERSSEERELLLPPQKTLIALLSKAQVGDIISLRSILDELRTGPEKDSYASFLTRIEAMVESFHFEALEEYLTQKLKEEE